ncbi:hypothetical protein TNCV_3578551 [Trichonephila clavipes]|nr:hypothetical protein TNCV_3578551 [Trichonephila clavipes]
MLFLSIFMYYRIHNVTIIDSFVLNQERAAATLGLLAMELVILNHRQVMRTTPELVLHAPNILHVNVSILTHDRFNVASDRLYSARNRNSDTTTPITSSRLWPLGFLTDIMLHLTL